MRTDVELRASTVPKSELSVKETNLGLHMAGGDPYHQTNKDNPTQFELSWSGSGTKFIFKTLFRINFVAYKLCYFKLCYYRLPYKWTLKYKLCYWAMRVAEVRKSNFEGPQLHIQNIF